MSFLLKSPNTPTSKKRKATETSATKEDEHIEVRGREKGRREEGGGRREGGWGRREGGRGG